MADLNDLKQTHYGWTVLAAGTLGVFAALGLARFGYSSVLPAMQSDLGINNSQAGLLATANLTGYLLLSMLVGLIASKFGIRATASAGLMLAGVSMLMTGGAERLSALVFWRALTGAGSGMANISIMGLWPAWFSSKKRGLASGVAVSGSSVALILTGLFVPEILNRYGQDAWRTCWYIYGAATIMVSVIVYGIIRNSAGEKGYERIGGDNVFVKGSVTTQKTGLKDVYLSSSVWFLGFVYLAYGFSYIIYTTFFMKHLISGYSYTTAEAGRLFMLIGWFSLGCGLAWGMISDKVGRKAALIMLYLLNAASFALYAFAVHPYQLVFSAILFGLSAWSIPAIMAASCGDMLGHRLAPAALGFITLFFGIGQVAGPAVAGHIADLSGSFKGAFTLAAAVSAAGAFMSVYIRKRKAADWDDC